MTDANARTVTLRDALLVAVSGNDAELERIYTPDVAGWSPVTEVASRDDLAADLKIQPAPFSEINVVLDPVDAIGDKLIAEWRLTAAHTGVLALDDLRLEPTGRRIELHGVYIAEFDGARIRRFRQYWDEAELLDGLGLLSGDVAPTR